jgi:hypothetical protein
MKKRGFTAVFLAAAIALALAGTTPAAPPEQSRAGGLRKEYLFEHSNFFRGENIFFARDAAGGPLETSGGRRYDRGAYIGALALGVMTVIAPMTAHAAPALTGTVNIAVDSNTGAVTASVTGSNATNFNYAWYNSLINIGNSATLNAQGFLGSGVYVEVTDADGAKTGNVTGGVTVYRVDLYLSGNVGTDTASIANPYGKAGDVVSIAYTLGNSGTQSNTLTYSGSIGTNPAQVTTAGSGTSSYTIAGMMMGVDLLTATFAHTSAPDNTAPVLTAGTVSRTSDTGATVKFTSTEDGQCYYQVVADNAGDPNINTSGAGALYAASEVIIPLTSLTAGAKDIWIYFKDAAGNIGKLKIDIPAYTSGGGGGGGCNAGAAGLLAVSGVARAIMKRAGKKSKN